MASATEYDVIVVGAGNAALCAALSAREQGSRVLVLEKASEEERGGNSTFTAGGFRFVHDGLEDLRRDVLADLSDAEARQIYIPPLPADLYMHDLMKVTEGLSQEELANLLIGRSRETVVWMQGKGVRFIPCSAASPVVNGMHHFYGGVNIEAVGGGWAGGFPGQGGGAPASRSAIAPAQQAAAGQERRHHRRRSRSVRRLRGTTPAPWCWPAAGSKPTPDAHRYLGLGWEL